ncbi:MAG: hemolysin family protein [Actinobacteria bacterium]|nr:hemolysin family protein [Actinomycetota bacterium]
MPYWVYIIGIIFLLGVAAFTSAAETALTSMNRLRAKHLMEQRVAGAKALDRLLEHPGRFLATTLFLNSVVNIAIASIMTVIVATYTGHYVAAIATGLAAFIVLVFGEITPKTFSAQNAQRIALWVAPVMNVLNAVLSPLVHIFVWIANLFVLITGGKTVKEVPFTSEEEIKALVTMAEEEEIIEEDEKELIHSIFEFGDTVVREVMVPRTGMVAIEAGEPIEELMKLFVHEGHSRVPVFEESIDNIVGIAYSRDVLVQLAQGAKELDVKAILRPAYFVPESKKVNELLRELQRKHQHIAIVVDEYGGTAGLVTLEDVLEELVGEIFDEYDVVETTVEYVDTDTIRVDARVSIDEVNELLGVDLEHDDIDTIGGFVVGLMGRIPNPGDQADFENLTFRVEEVDGRRIAKVLITKRAEITAEK